MYGALVTVDQLATVLYFTIIFMSSFEMNVSYTSMHVYGFFREPLIEKKKFKL